MVEPDVEMREPTIRKLNIKSMQGQVRTIEIHPDAFIRDLKAKTALVFTVPPERQRLIYQGKLLKDDSRLSEYVKEDGCTVHLMIKAEESASQDRRPQPGMFGVQGSNPGDPMNMFGQMGPMMQQAFPGGNVQAFQVQMGPGGPSFQYIPGPGGQIPAQNPGQAIPVQIRVQASPQVAPNSPPAGNGEERKVREIALPFAHVHNLGHIVNSLTGPATSFPQPPMPLLPFNRNTLVLLGGFLYNYQFQLMRLIPFLSRLADLFQRESLITDPQQRAEMQNFSRVVGAAMQEVSLATQPVVELFQRIEIGPAPGQYQLRVHGANVVSQQEVVGPRPQPSVPRPNPAAQGNAPVQNPGQQLLSSLLNPPGGLPPDSPLARMGPTLQQALNGGMGNMSIRDLMLASDVHENEEDLPLMEFLYSLTVPELTTLMSGDVAPLERIRPIAAQNLRNAMGGTDTPEARLHLLQVYQQYIQTHLILPENFAVRQRPGFIYIEATNSLVQKAVSRLVSLVLDDASNDFGNRLKHEFQQRVGEWAEVIIEGMEGGVQTLDLLLRAQIQASIAEMGGGESASAILAMSYGLIQQLLSTCLQARRVEREAQNPSAVLIETWRATIEADTRIQESIPPQRPFSRVYRTLDVFRPPEPQEPLQPRKLLRVILSQALQESGVALQGAELSPDLCAAFSEQLGKDIRSRVETDPDYDKERFKNIETVIRR